MIPKIIHQIWIGDAKIPERERIFCEKVKEMHPDWIYMFWDNDSINKLDNKYLQKMNRIASITNTPSFVVDYLKFVLLYEFGGAFLDVDFEMKDSLNKLNLTKRIILSRDNHFAPRGLQFGFMASEAKHEFVENVLFDKKNIGIINYFAYLNKLFITYYFPEIKKKNPDISLNFKNCTDFISDMEILDRKYFFRGVIAFHHYLGSHKPNKKKFFTIKK